MTAPRKRWKFSKPIRAQVEVLARAFEGGAFDDLLPRLRSALRQVTEARASAREVLGDEALAREEALLGEPLRPEASRTIRLVEAEARQYFLWCLCCDVEKALRRREGARRTKRVRKGGQP